MFSGITGFGFCQIPQTNFLLLENLLVCCTIEYQVEKLRNFVEPFEKPPNSDLADQMTQLFESMDHSDITFTVQGKEFHPHKAILACRSPMFAAMFQNEMREKSSNRANIVDMDPDTFQAILRFIYTGQVDLNLENCETMLQASNFCLIEQLKWKCESFMAKHLKMNNCCDVLALAEVHAAKNLKKAALNFVCVSAAEVMKTDGWKKMRNKHHSLVSEVLEHLL